jgi:hypothetical protein
VEEGDKPRARAAAQRTLISKLNMVRPCIFMAISLDVVSLVRTGKKKEAPRTLPTEPPAWIGISKWVPLRRACRGAWAFRSSGTPPTHASLARFTRRTCTVARPFARWLHLSCPPSGPNPSCDHSHTRKSTSAFSPSFHPRSLSAQRRAGYSGPEISKSWTVVRHNVFSAVGN